MYLYVYVTNISRRPFFFAASVTACARFITRFVALVTRASNLIYWHLLRIYLMRP